MKGRVAILVLGLGAVGVGVFAMSKRSHEDAVPVKVGKPVGGKVIKTDAEWRAMLSPEVYAVTRDRGTERACSGAHWMNKGDGVYHCVCCDQPLFDSGAKYDSGTGWPSFFQPVSDDALSLYEDTSGFMIRTEIQCSRCDAHLGHVFEDGPRPTGLRYCLNSLALKFAAR
jgi:peptide-methionine (R)-S-oxide reductase